MKKTIFFAVLVFVSFSIKAQIINTNTTQIESASYIIKENVQCTDHAQKILKYRDDAYIILDKEYDTSRFYFVKVDDRTSIRASIPPEFKVNDFSILGDSIYFCGYKLNDTNTLNDGFIAYTAISDMFFTGNNYIYSLIQSTYNVYKVLTYYNDNNDRIVAAIGGQMYGDFTYVPIAVNPNPTLESKTIHGADGGGAWTVANPISRDCFIHYRVMQNTYVTNAVNGIDMYYSSYTNHSNVSSNIEMFENFVLTDNYICIVSKYYIYSSGETKYLLRRIERNNIVNQVTNLCSAADFAQNTEDISSVPLKDLGNNTIAWSYNAVVSNGDYYTAIYKIDLSTTPFFTSLLASKIDECSNRCLTWDLEYFAEHEQLLLLLKQQTASDNSHIDMIYYINMKNTTTFPYTTLAFIPLDENGQMHFCSNSLLKHSNDYFYIVGTKDYINICDKHIMNYYTIYNCNKVIHPVVENLSNVVFYTFANLSHCTFADQTNIVYLPAYITICPFVAWYIGKTVTKYCENEEYDLKFHLN